MSTYRVGRTYGVHVYQGDRPVATFFDADEAAAFVAAANAQIATDGLLGAQISAQWAQTGGSGDGGQP